MRTCAALARVTNLAFSTDTNEWLSVAYAYDAGDRRTNETWSTGREMAYGYDAAHQLTEVEAARPSDAARYAYDPAGNPVERAELGFEVTNAFNNLNQIMSGSWTGSTITAVGAVNYPAGIVTVSGAEGTIYADKTFDAAGVPVALGANTLTNVFTDIFGRSVTNTSHVTIANRAYVHDANGNLTDDGVFQYQYDAANQLTNVVRTADGARVLSARYDALGRRVEAIRGDGSVERYVYFPGSFLVLAVLDGTNAVKEIYTRGPDLSGSLDGAGGIGGILACTYASGATYCSHADIMGNVIALTDASGSVVSTFRYTPFGQLSARTGSVLPRYLFSSKEFDRTANLYYYGYRYYAPRLGRWMTRDPIGEKGGVGLYLCFDNVPVNIFDAIGLVGGGFKYRGRKHESIGWWRYAASPASSDTSCICKKKWFSCKYRMRCRLSVEVDTLVNPKDRRVWEGKYDQLIRDTLLHEQHHVANYRKWYNEHVALLKEWEKVIFPDKVTCTKQAQYLEQMISDSWSNMYDDELNHKGYGW